jgi:hypothetical protein
MPSTINALSDLRPFNRHVKRAGDNQVSINPFYNLAVCRALRPARGEQRTGLKQAEIPSRVRTKGEGS